MSSSLEKPIIQMIGDKKYSCKLLPKTRTIRVKAKKNKTKSEEEPIYEELDPEESLYAEVGPAGPIYEKPVPLYEVPVTRSKSRSRSKSGSKKGLYIPGSESAGGARKTYKRKRTHKKKKKTRRLRRTRK